MAKKISVLSCPNCGNSGNVPVKENHYRCTSCSTEYFIENNDINVNVRHSYESQQTPEQPSRSQKIVGFIVSALVVLIVILMTVISNWGSDSVGSQSGGGSKAEYQIHVGTPIEINKKPYVVCFGQRKDSKEREASQEWGVYYFYNIEEDKVENVTKIDGFTKYKQSALRCFADGNYYLSLNKTQIFKLNKEKLTFEDYSQVIRDSDPEFSSGFASITITYSRDGDAFDIMSNMGGEYKYYPIIDKVYTSSNATKQSRGMNTLLPQARDSTYYMFTKKSSAYYGPGSVHPIQLMGVTFKYNGGGPQMVNKSEEYSMKSGGKVALFYNDADRIVSYKDVTPERAYFDPYIAYADKDNLLISVRANAASDAQVSIQKIDKESGQVEWSTMVPTPDRRPFYYFDESLKVGDKYIIKEDYNIFFLIDKDGKFIKEIKL